MHAVQAFDSTFTMPMPVQVRKAQISIGDREVVVNSEGERVSRLKEVNSEWIIRRLERWGRKVTIKCCYVFSRASCHATHTFLSGLSSACAHTGNSAVASLSHFGVRPGRDAFCGAPEGGSAAAPGAR